MKMPAPMWAGVSVVAAVAVGVVSYLVTLLLRMGTTLLPEAFALAILVIMLGMPYMKKQAIVDSIERNFSDALKQMADTLKAGDTYESALREVANSDYGRLSEEMSLALRRLEEGENLETALNGFAQRVDSRLVRRTILIVLDSVRTGASLSDILDEISDDVRDFQRLKDDRKSNTTMQFLFLVAAGGIIAPMIFGEINAVMGSLSNITLQTMTAAQKVAADAASGFMVIMIQFYLIIEVMGSGAMMSIIREGKLNKSVIYIPVLLLIAFVMYYVTTFAIGMMLKGAM